MCYVSLYSYGACVVSRCTFFPLCIHPLELYIISRHGSRPTETRVIGTMLFQCWAVVCDGVTKLNQHRDRDHTLHYQSSVCCYSIRKSPRIIFSIVCQQHKPRTAWSEKCSTSHFILRGVEFTIISILHIGGQNRQ